MPRLCRPLPLAREITERPQSGVLEGYDGDRRIVTEFCVWAKPIGDLRRSEILTRYVQSCRIAGFAASTIDGRLKILQRYQVSVLDPEAAIERIDMAEVIATARHARRSAPIIHFKGLFSLAQLWRVLEVPNITNCGWIYRRWRVFYYLLLLTGRPRHNQKDCGRKRGSRYLVEC